MELLKTYIDSFLGTLNWTWNLISFNEIWYKNYFYGLILISLVVWFLELMFPWRKDQSAFRKDFWLDGFYMFFNFFVFSICVAGLYAVIELLAKKVGFGMDSIALINLGKYQWWIALPVFFVLNDFVQWFTHVLLHRYRFFWNFHKVHHSVEEMGFAAHLRYHWMENILYKPLKTLIVMLIGGFEPEQAYMIHFFAITIGHLNHANIRITWGPLKYVFNNPVMHIYHHAKHLPEERMPGVNYAISLSCWDYIFKTAYIPQSKDGGIELGFDGIEEYPKTFFAQIISGFKSK